jgi:hypothetical protein
VPSNGISFSGHGISQQQRELLKTLAHEYHQRVAREEAAEMEVEEVEVEEEGEEAMEASETGNSGAGANQEAAAPHSSVALPASTVPHPRTLSAAAGDLQQDYLYEHAGGAAGSSGSQGASKQIRTHVFSATEIGAAIASASEAVSSGPEREFDGLVTLLSSCRSLMAVEPVVHFKP